MRVDKISHQRPYPCTTTNTLPLNIATEGLPSNDGRGIDVSKIARANYVSNAKRGDTMQSGTFASAKANTRCASFASPSLFVEVGADKGQIAILKRGSSSGEASSMMLQIASQVGYGKNTIVVRCNNR